MKEPGDWLRGMNGNDFIRNPADPGKNSYQQDSCKDHQYVENFPYL
jgi:hypothetical protein